MRLDSDEDNVDDKDKVANEIFHDGLDSDDDLDQVNYLLRNLKFEKIPKFFSYTLNRVFILTD